jgi:hypothetical protein
MGLNNFFRKLFAREKVSTRLQNSIAALEFKNSEMNIKFEGTNLNAINLSDYYILPIKKDSNGGNILSGVISSTIVPSTISMMNPHGLFTATINPQLLTKLADGTFSTMVHGSKGIAGHFGFTSISASVFTPIIIFQVMSMLTGQYFLNGITKQLTRLENRIEELLKLYHNERISKINVYKKRIDELFRRNFPQIEDLVELRNMRSEISVIFEEYKNEVLGIKLENIIISKKWFTQEKLWDIIEKDEEYNFDFFMKMLTYCDAMLYIIDLLELVLNIRIGSVRSDRINEILVNINNWNYSDFFRNLHGNRWIKEYYDTIIKRAKEISYDAFFQSDRDWCNKNIRYLEYKKNELTEFVINQNDIIEMRNNIVNKLSNQIEVLLYIDNGNENFLIKK